MPGKRDRCDNCGKPMRRLYMQKNKPNGTRGMMATGWLCEGCNFSDIITKFKKNKSKEHSILTCKCLDCGSHHKKEYNGDGSILNLLARPEKQIDGLIKINSINNPSEQLGLVFGVFIWATANHIRKIAKEIFTAHATYSQRELIETIWKESWRYDWKPIQDDKFKKKVAERLIDINQIYGIGIIMNSEITEFTFKAIDMIESPIYLDLALVHNRQLAEKYSNKALSEGNTEFVEQLLPNTIKAGNYDFLEKFVEIKGTDASEFIIEQYYHHDKITRLSKISLRKFYEALSKTKTSEAALVLVKESFSNERKFSKDYFANFAPEIHDKLGTLNRRSYWDKIQSIDSPLIKAMITTTKQNHSDIDNSYFIAALLSFTQDYKLLEFLLELYKGPKNLVKLLRDIVIESDHDKARIFIRKVTGITSGFYEHHFLNTNPEKVCRFLVDDDPALRLMGTSMSKSEDIGVAVKEWLFKMSLFDLEESVRIGATETVKEKGVSQIIDVLDLDELFNRHDSKNYFLFFQEKHFSKENIKRLIDYNDSRLLPYILADIHTAPELNKKIISLLKTFDIRDRLVEMLFERRYILGDKALQMAIIIDKQKTHALIKNGMQVIKTTRAERKRLVNIRLDTIDLFAQQATSDDIPYIQKLIKKDRSPRVKKKLASLMMSLS